MIDRRTFDWTSLLFALVLIAAFFYSCGAFGHKAPSGWAYPRDCCSGFDCRAVPADDVQELDGGRWLYRPLGIVFPASTVRPSRDRHVHVCYQQWDKRPLCIFILQGA